ncbi:MAG: NADH-quinone oxidoreductase subunit NuoF [Syntrophomonadaceae bacterium]|jgi:NADH-quinone oxidoreductase subunit F|nr:NADH-quinone oxidoreductase subunit NuoF [Syntrophomonadaceae bacterium]
MRIRVGLGSCGMAAGALEVYEAASQEAANRGLELEVQQTGCIGMCYLEPLLDVLMDDGQVYTYGLVTPEMVQRIFNEHIEGGRPVEEHLVGSTARPADFLAGQVRVALRNCGIIDPESIDSYIEQGGYRALEKALRNMTPEEVIEQITMSGLRGRGGAGFPAGLKWSLTREAEGSPKFIICNADEGDPGAFMDRSILEGDPHAVLEGMALAGYAIGAVRGMVYVRAEYPVAVRRLQMAIEQARNRGWLGQNLLDSGFDFDIDIKQGAGAFVCGEETALIASLEGERGMPSLKPPFPSEAGYSGRPTSVNNVETLANVPWIIEQGGQALASMGSEKSKGTKVFALAGKVKRGGLVEVPMGISLREVIFQVGGGIKDDHNFKAVQMGGPSGGCIPAELLDTPVDYESITSTGAIMGSGGMIVMDETTCMVDIARFFLDFTQKESCGKCVQCRIGTKRMLEILERICTGQGQESDLELLEELAEKVRDGSLCGLGQSAPNPVLTTMRYFREEYEAHIRDRKCPAGQCKELISYRIEAEKCKGCTLCVKKCPVNCIVGEKRKPHVIEQEQCIKCGTCMEVCPTRFSAVTVE